MSRTACAISHVLLGKVRGAPCQPAEGAKLRTCRQGDSASSIRSRRPERPIGTAEPLLGHRRHRCSARASLLQETGRVGQALRRSSAPSPPRRRPCGPRNTHMPAGPHERCRRSATPRDHTRCSDNARALPYPRTARAARRRRPASRPQRRSLELADSGLV